MKVRYGLLVLFLVTTFAGTAQFVVEKHNGSTLQVDGNLTFTKDPATGNWALGEVYDGQMQLDSLAVIRLAENEPADPFANKTCWVYGVKAPEFPGRDNLPVLNVGALGESYFEGVWARFNHEEKGIDFEKHFLTWADTCGWYDCQKTYSIDNAPDNNHCWSASAANLLHWWLVQNADYIARYDEIYGQEYGYPRPSEAYRPPMLNNLASNKSEIFKFFINTFANRAGWSASAVNWFINGNSTNISAPFRDPSMIDSFVGFFPEVFSKSDIIATDERNMSKENFNALLKEAFTENKAIGVGVYDIAGTGTGSHALTIWGAEFDSEGYASHVYYVENNMPDQDPNGAVIVRIGITYLSDPDIPRVKVAHFQQLPKPFGGRQNTYLITDLSLVDLRRDIWEAAAAEWDAVQEEE